MRLLWKETFLVSSTSSPSIHSSVYSNLIVAFTTTKKHVPLEFNDFVYILDVLLRSHFFDIMLAFDCVDHFLNFKFSFMDSSSWSLDISACSARFDFQLRVLSFCNFFLGDTNEHAASDNHTHTHAVFWIPSAFAWGVYSPNSQIPQAHILAELTSLFFHWISQRGCPTETSNSIYPNFTHHSHWPLT